MKLIKMLSVMVFLLFTAVSVPSHAMGRKYSEIQLSQNTFIVSIQATNTTSPHKALSGLLTRAAEITIKHEYKYFVVINMQDQSDVRNSAFFSHGSGSSIGTNTTSKVPHSQITIKCFKDQPKEDNLIDADFFLKNKKP